MSAMDTLSTKTTGPEVSDIDRLWGLLTKKIGVRYLLDCNRREHEDPNLWIDIFYLAPVRESPYMEGVMLEAEAMHIRTLCGPRFIAPRFQINEYSGTDAGARSFIETVLKEWGKRIEDGKESNSCSSADPTWFQAEQFIGVQLLGPSQTIGMRATSPQLMFYHCLLAWNMKIYEDLLRETESRGGDSHQRSILTALIHRFDGFVLEKQKKLDGND